MKDETCYRMHLLILELGTFGHILVTAMLRVDKRLEVLFHSVSLFHYQLLVLLSIEIMLCPLFLFLFRDLSFGIRKLHQIHFVFLLIVLGYQSLFLFSSFSFSLDLISIAGKEFTSHRI